MEILSVTKSAFQYIRARILTGEFPPGEKLNESQLVELLGISRPPLREAFRLLENEHLVVNLPRRGTYVSDVSIDEFRELYQVREMIECYAVDLLEKQGISEVPEVRASWERTPQLPVATDAEPEEKLQHQSTIAGFHVALVEAAGNSRLIHIYLTIMSNLIRYQLMYHFMPGVVRDAHASHRDILGHIQSGDYDTAKERIKGHIKHFVALLEEKMGV